MSITVIIIKDLLKNETIQSKSIDFHCFIDICVLGTKRKGI